VRWTKTIRKPELGPSTAGLGSTFFDLWAPQQGQWGSEELMAPHAQRKTPRGVAFGYRRRSHGKARLRRPWANGLSSNGGTHRSENRRLRCVARLPAPGSVHPRSMCGPTKRGPGTGTRGRDGHREGDGKQQKRRKKIADDERPCDLGEPDLRTPTIITSSGSTSRTHGPRRRRSSGSRPGLRETEETDRPGFYRGSEQVG